MINNLFKLLADNRRAPQRRFEVKASADGAEAEVFLYDAVVNDTLEAEWFGGVAPEPFVVALRAIKADTIRLRINSPGGSVFGARAIEQALRDHPAKVVAHIDGLAASAASFIAMAADEIIMSKGGMMMIHKAWTLAYGNSDDLVRTSDLLAKIDGTLVQTYADRTKQSSEAIQQWMADETWFTSAEAVEHGFADSIAESTPNAQAAWNLSAYDKAPAQIADEADTKSINRAAYLRRIDSRSIPA